MTFSFLLEMGVRPRLAGWETTGEMVPFPAEKCPPIFPEQSAWSVRMVLLHRKWWCIITTSGISGELEC